MKNINSIHFLFYVCTLLAVVFIDSRYNLKGGLYLSYLLLTYFVYNNFYSPVKKQIFKIHNVKYILLILASTTCIFILNDLIFSILFYQEILISNSEVTEQYSAFFIIKAIMIAPFLEELIFRGLFLDGLLKKYSSIKAVFFCALGFSFSHILSDTGLLQTFLFGMLISYVFYKTKSLVLCFMGHAFNNLLVILFLNIKIPMYLNINQLIILIVIVILLLVLLAKKIQEWNLNKHI